MHRRRMYLRCGCDYLSNSDTVHSRSLLVTPFTEIAIDTLTHWGRVTHICVSKLTIIASDNGLSSGRRQAIMWTSAGILLIGPLGTNFSEIWIEITTFSFKKMRLKVSSAKWRPCCLGLNVLKCTRKGQILVFFISFKSHQSFTLVVVVLCAISYHNEQW